MMWTEVMKRVIAVIRMDASLVSVYQGQIRAAGTGAQKVPGLEWSLIGDVETELWEPFIIQIDQWVNTVEALEASELRLRSLFHRDLPIRLGGIMFWAQYIDGVYLPVPDRSNYLGRGLRFRFTPLRRQYAQPVAAPVLPDRSTRTFATAVLADQGVELGSVILADSLDLIEITSNIASRIVFYATPEARDADTWRALGVDPIPGTGVQAEFEFPIGSTIQCGPVVDIANDEHPETSAIFYAVTNLSGVPASVEVTVVYVPTERR